MSEPAVDAVEEASATAVEALFVAVVAREPASLEADSFVFGVVALVRDEVVEVDSVLVTAVGILMGSAGCPGDVA